jgi:hypothetical protein
MQPPGIAITVGLRRRAHGFTVARRGAVVSPLRSPRIETNCGTGQIGALGHPGVPTDRLLQCGRVLRHHALKLVHLVAALTEGGLHRGNLDRSMSSPTAFTVHRPLFATTRWHAQLTQTRKPLRRVTAYQRI